MGKEWKQCQTLFFWAPKSLQMVIAAMKLKDAYSLQWNYDQTRQNIKKQTHYLVNKGPSSQGYGFSSSHVWMRELDYIESWVQKNWCFWTVVLENILKSPLDCKEIQPIHPKGDQSWVFIGRSNVEAKTPILWSPYSKSWLIWKDPDDAKFEGRRRRGRQRMRWLHGITNSIDMSWSKLQVYDITEWLTLSLSAKENKIESSIESSEITM